MGVLFEGMAAKANAINGTISDGTIFKKIDIVTSINFISKCNSYLNSRMVAYLQRMTISVDIF